MAAPSGGPSTAAPGVAGPGSPLEPPAFIGRAGPTPWHRLNPLTKLVAALATGAGAIVAGGFVIPALLLAAGVVIPAAVARQLQRVLRAVVVLTLPLAISVLVVNLLFFPGGEAVLFRIGPLAATAEGLGYAIEVIVRLVAIAGGVVVFYLTTEPGDLTLDLERRGVSPRVAFVVNASVQMVPAMAERAATITAAQRARGLDTEGSILARARGVLPIVGPVILGAIGEVEERTLALEARAFGRPGRRTLLWAPADSTRQRVARWGMAALAPVLAAVRGLTGLP
jgi:energy-coupling factor transport system permease protein